MRRRAAMIADPRLLTVAGLLLGAICLFGCSPDDGSGSTEAVTSPAGGNPAGAKWGIDPIGFETEANLTVETGSTHASMWNLKTGLPRPTDPYDLVWEVGRGNTLDEPVTIEIVWRFDIWDYPDSLNPNVWHENGVSPWVLDAGVTVCKWDPVLKKYVPDPAPGSEGFLKFEFEVPYGQTISNTASVTSENGITLWMTVTVEAWNPGVVPHR